MIKNANYDDVQAITALWNHYVENTNATFRAEPLSESQVCDVLRDCLANNWPFYVAQSDKLLGFALFRKFRPVGYDRTMEHTLYISPNARGQGIGGALLNALKMHAQAIGVHVLIGMVTAENDASIAFHSKHGFDHTATLPQLGYKNGQYLDVAVMQCYID